MKRWIQLSVVAIMSMHASVGHAEVLSSPNLRMDKSTVGAAGGQVESSSANLKVGDALGQTSVGESSSPNFSTADGIVGTNDPRLAVNMISSSVNFGTFSTLIPSTGTTQFSVLNYTSYGYVVQVVGTAPSTAGRPLNSMSNAASTPGTEQFGINLVANTLPASLSGSSANPLQVPDGTFSNGFAHTGYDTANAYSYGNGAMIARATKSSGRTDYTVSYVVNVSAKTPAGRYTAEQAMVVVATY